MKPAALIFIVCIVPVALIRAQPYDDHDLRAFLAPSGMCSATCFLGIRPGVTTAQEAVAVLEAHAWISEIDYSYYDPQRLPRNLISWTWSGLQPGLINGTQVGSMEFAVWDEPGIQKVTQISIATHITFANLVLTAGPPTSSWLSYDSFGVFRDLNVHTGTFQAAAFQVSTRVECPPSVLSLAHQPIFRLTYGLPTGNVDLPVTIGRPSEYFDQYYLRGPFPRYLERDLKRFPGC